MNQTTCHHLLFSETIYKTDIDVSFILEQGPSKKIFWIRPPIATYDVQKEFLKLTLPFLLFWNRSPQKFILNQATYCNVQCSERISKTDNAFPSILEQIPSKNIFWIRLPTATFIVFRCPKKLCKIFNVFADFQINILKNKQYNFTIFIMKDLILQTKPIHGID